MNKIESGVFVSAYLKDCEELEKIKMEMTEIIDTFFRSHELTSEAILSVLLQFLKETSAVKAKVAKMKKKYSVVIVKRFELRVYQDLFKQIFQRIKGK